MTYNGLKHAFKQPMVIASLVIALLWVLTDANSRLLPSSTQSVLNNNTQEAKTIPELLLNNAEHDFIAQQYQHFKRDEEAVKQTEQQLTAEQQLAQQGLMQQVFINDNKLTLKAVIHERNSTASESEAMQAYALINQTHLPTTQSKLVKINNKQSIEGFTLTILSSTQVKLTRNHSSGEQQVTLTMYRVADKIK